MSFILKDGIFTAPDEDNWVDVDASHVDFTLHNGDIDFYIQFLLRGLSSVLADIDLLVQAPKLHSNPPSEQRPGSLVYPAFIGVKREIIGCVSFVRNFPS